MPPRATSQPTQPNHKTNNSKLRSSPRLKYISMSQSVNKATATPMDSKKQANNTSKIKLKENITSAINKPVTPKSKLKPIEAETSTKSVKKSGWKRRPKPAHSGVPVPEKMKKMLVKFLLDDDEKST